MATVIQGRVLDNNLQDLFASVDQLQKSRQMNEAKRMNDLKAAEDYLSKLAEGNNLGITGAMRENPDIAKRYLALSGVGKKEIDSVYNQMIGQTLTGELRTKEILGEARERGQGGAYSDEPIPKKDTPSTPEETVPDSIPLSPSGSVQGRGIVEQPVSVTAPIVGKGTAVSPERAALENELKALEGKKYPEVKTQEDLNRVLAMRKADDARKKELTLGLREQEKAEKAYATSSWTDKGVVRKEADVSFGEVKGDRFVSTKYFKPENSNQVVTDLLISSGFDAKKIEQSDVDFYKSFIANANNVKDFSELAGKAFKIPPRPIGINEQEIIAKLTPELQRKYADLMVKKAEAEKRGNMNGAAMAQKQMNTMTSGMTGTHSPFSLTDREYNELGVIFGVSGKRNIDNALSQFTQMDMGTLDAALKQAQIGAYESQVVKDAWAVKRDQAEINAINEQMRNGGMTESQIIDMNIKLMEQEKLKRELTKEPAKSLSKSYDEFVATYSKLADKQGVSDEQKRAYIASQIKNNTGAIPGYRENYLQVAQDNNYGVFEENYRTPEEFEQAKYTARMNLMEDLDAIMFDHFSDSLGVGRDKKSKNPFKDWVGGNVEAVLQNPSLNLKGAETERDATFYGKKTDRLDYQVPQKKDVVTGSRSSGNVEDDLVNRYK